MLPNKTKLVHPEPKVLLPQCGCIQQTQDHRWLAEGHTTSGC